MPQFFSFLLRITNHFFIFTSFIFILIILIFGFNVIVLKLPLIFFFYEFLILLSKPYYFFIISIFILTLDFLLFLIRHDIAFLGQQVNLFLNYYQIDQLFDVWVQHSRAYFKSIYWW